MTIGRLGWNHASHDMANIHELAHERESWSDTQLLDELRSLPALPDEDYFSNADEDGEYRRMALAMDTYLAIVELTKSRHLIDAIPLLLERASYGDFGETMRSLPDSLYRIADVGGSAMARLRPGYLATPRQQRTLRWRR